MDNEPKIRYRFILRLTFGLLGCGLIGALIWSATRPDLEWYVSPPLDEVGHRANLLIPRGWKISRSNSAMPEDGLSHNGQATAMFMSSESRMLGWLRPFIRQFTVQGSISITLSRSKDEIDWTPEYPADGSEMVVNRTYLGDFFLAARTIKSDSPAIYGSIVYCSSDQATFEPLHSTICNSFKIIGGTETRAR